LDPEIPVGLARKTTPLFAVKIKPKKTKRMKPTTDTPNFLQDANALNEEILEAAEKIDAESLAPEVSSRTAEITVWDESPEDVGWRVQERPMDNQVTISEELVSEGNEQADREQRMAAGAGDAEVAP
jgi:hypothetical protein